MFHIVDNHLRWLLLNPKHQINVKRSVQPIRVDIMAVTIGSVSNIDLATKETPIQNTKAITFIIKII